MGCVPPFLVRAHFLKKESPASLTIGRRFLYLDKLLVFRVAEDVANRAVDRAANVIYVAVVRILVSAFLVGALGCLLVFVAGSILGRLVAARRRARVRGRSTGRRVPSFVLALRGRARIRAFGAS